MAKRARYVMSHESGKIEILYVNSEKIMLRYHRAIKGENYGQVLDCKVNPNAYWLNDLELVGGGKVQIKGTPYGPE